MSDIQWTDHTWNPSVGCTKVSAGCENCYAMNIVHRMAKHPHPDIKAANYGLTMNLHGKIGIKWTNRVNFHLNRLEIPLNRRKPTIYFVNSLSDLFHEAISDDEIDMVLAVMAITPRHTYQILTKRPQRMLDYFRNFSKRAKEYGGDRWLIQALASNVVGEDELLNGKYQNQKMVDLPLPNVWLGVSVENQQAADQRIPLLLQTPAALRFLSCEPLLEEVDFRRSISKSAAKLGTALFKVTERSYVSCPIDWVIVGGESGTKARPCQTSWLRSIVWQCKVANVPCFVKQLGALRLYQDIDINWVDRASGKGEDPEDWPEDLRVREMPNPGT